MTKIPEPWYTALGAAIHARLAEGDIVRACEEGALHGERRGARGSWRVRVVCLDAWLDGRPCPHQEGGEPTPKPVTR